MRIKPRARDDLLAIRAWGEDRWGPDRTRDFLEGLIDALERLEAHPLMGRAREAFLPGLRSVRYRGAARAAQPRRARLRRPTRGRVAAPSRPATVPCPR